MILELLIGYWAWTVNIVFQKYVLLEDGIKATIWYFDVKKIWNLIFKFIDNRFQTIVKLGQINVNE